MKTYSPKPREVQQDWYEVDATGAVRRPTAWLTSDDFLHTA